MSGEETDDGPPRIHSHGESWSEDPIRKHTALIVEDSIIIAMEAEDILGELGFTNCSIAGSVDGAQRIVERGDVGFALLDINLGNETSEPIARLLQEKRIPFIFTSGYDDGPFKSGEFAAVTTLTKPYSERDLIAAIRKVMTA